MAAAVEDPAPGQITGKSLLCGAVACVAVGGPLLAMMYFTFLGSSILLLLGSPLLLLFSPLLLLAASVFVLALAGFAASAGVALAGLWALRWAFWLLQEMVAFPARGGVSGLVSWGRQASSPLEMLQLGPRRENGLAEIQVARKMASRTSDL